jgi:CheY-like chemotaxis protein
MLRVLVVDDEPLIAMLLNDWLTELGHQPIGPANSVPGALALIERFKLDGAILDVSLGGQESYELADVLSARGVPLVFATGRCSDTLLDRFANSQRLTKPFDFEGLSRVVQELVAQSIGLQNPAKRP